MGIFKRLSRRLNGQPPADRASERPTHDSSGGSGWASHPAFTGEQARGPWGGSGARWSDTGKSISEHPAMQEASRLSKMGHPDDSHLQAHSYMIEHLASNYSPTEGAHDINRTLGKMRDHIQSQYGINTGDQYGRNSGGGNS